MQRPSAVGLLPVATVIACGGSVDTSAAKGGASAGGIATKYPVAAPPVSLVVADFNLDGQPDLAAANRDSNTVSLLLGACAGETQGVGGAP